MANMNNENGTRHLTEAAVTLSTEGYKQVRIGPIFNK